MVKTLLPQLYIENHIPRQFKNKNVKACYYKKQREESERVYIRNASYYLHFQLPQSYFGLAIHSSASCDTYIHPNTV